MSKEIQNAQDKIKRSNGVLQAKLWEKLENYENGEIHIEELKATSNMSRTILRSALADLEYAKLKEASFELLDRSHQFFGNE